GVNCTRWNWPPIALARVFTASVLARPGTPSTRMCPRESSATRSRASRMSWPTMVFLTSYRTCPTGLGSSMLIPWSRLLLGSSTARSAADGAPDGYGEADADEGARTGRVGQGHHNPDHL